MGVSSGLAGKFEYLERRKTLKGGSTDQVAQALGHVGAHGKAQARLVPGAQGGQNQAVVLRQVAAANLLVKRAHRGAKL